MVSGNSTIPIIKFGSSGNAYINNIDGTIYGNSFIAGNTNYSSWGILFKDIYEIYGTSSNNN